MANFGENLGTASQRAHTARDQLSGTTTHLVANFGINHSVDLDFYIATVLKTLTRLLKESLDDPEMPEHVGQRIEELQLRGRDAMYKQAAAAYTLREFYDDYRDFLAQPEINPQSRLDGKTRR